MTGFRRTASGVSARFSAPEAAILRSLISQIAELIGGGPLGDDGPAAGTGLPQDSGPPQDAGLPADLGLPGEAGLSGGPGTGGTDDLADLLGELEKPALPPDDPVLARLFPDAYRGDPEAAGEFRRYTEDSLREAKTETARLVLATLPEGGGRVRLSGEEAQAWLRALNDVRLALGVRLEITEDFEGQLARLAADDPRAGYFQVYDWLTYVQETLVRALW